MYDLKTASRLYVLEPHHKPVSAVSFAPDGRRLVTVSLEESDATVWKIGSSISGFFNVGGPPRQGGAAGEPYRRIPFIRADDGECCLERARLTQTFSFLLPGMWRAVTDEQNLSEATERSVT